MEHLSDDHEDRPNQQENIHKLYDEIGHPGFDFDGKSRKLRQQHDQNFSMEGMSL